MNRKTYLALSLGLLATFLAVDAAQAKWRLSIFAGNRAQVTNACSGETMELTQGVTYSMCVNFANHNVVICGDDGYCSGNWNDGTPDVTSADRGPRGKPMVAEGSLASESRSDSDAPGQPPADGGDDGGYDGPIFN